MQVKDSIDQDWNNSRNDIRIHCRYCIRFRLNMANAARVEHIAGQRKFHRSVKQRMAKFGQRYAIIH